MNRSSGFERLYRLIASFFIIVFDRLYGVGITFKRRFEIVPRFKQDLCAVVIEFGKLLFGIRRRKSRRLDQIVVSKRRETVDEGIFIRI